MRRTNLVLLALVQLCSAKQPGFSIHEDLLAHPQFEVVFSETYVLAEDAQLLIDGAARPKPSAITNADTITGTKPADDVPPHDSTSSLAVGQTNDETPPSSSTTNAGQGGGGGGDTTSDDGSEQISETFELINIPPLQYLCSVPVLSPPPGAANQTATDLARAAEARELARASDRGTEILNTLEGECMYYVNGWWSYSFCYGQEIVQFHTVPGKNGKAMKDPHSPEYVLGRMTSQHNRNDPVAEEAGTAAADAAAGGRKSKVKVGGDVEVQKPLVGAATPDDVPIQKKKKLDAHKTELQTKGDQKYMVQRLGEGTVCDLTGRDRTLEVQYHCNPGASGDRISWIKEVTTCSYLMEVRTPRLCVEPAFLPPKPKHAHPISCRLVVHSEAELAQWHEQKTIEAREAIPGGKSEEEEEKTTTTTTTGESSSPVEADHSGLVIGGVVVGARQLFADAVRDAADVVPALQNTKIAKAAKKAMNKGRPGGAGSGGIREALRAMALSKPDTGKFLGVVARGDGDDEDGNEGVIEVLDAEELAKLGVDATSVYELVEKMGVLTSGKPWLLCAYDTGEATPRLQAYFEDLNKAKTEVAEGEEPVQDKAKEADKKTGNKADRPTVRVTVKKVGKGKAAAVQDEGGKEGSDEGSEGSEEGSEETFKKDEL